MAVHVPADGVWTAGVVLPQHEVRVWCVHMCVGEGGGLSGYLSVGGHSFVGLVVNVTSCSLWSPPPPPLANAFVRCTTHMIDGMICLGIQVLWRAQGYRGHTGGSASWGLWSASRHAAGGQVALPHLSLLLFPPYALVSFHKLHRSTGSPCAQYRVGKGKGWKCWSFLWRHTLMQTVHVRCCLWGEFWMPQVHVALCFIFGVFLLFTASGTPRELRCDGCVRIVVSIPSQNSIQ